VKGQRAGYELLVENLEAKGIDTEIVKEALKQQRIETPSWGYANSGTRFKAFPWPGAAGTCPGRKVSSTTKSAG